MTRIDGIEHRPLPPEAAEALARVRLNRQGPEILGLHQTEGGTAPGNFVGVVRIGESILQVDSKFQNPEMDWLEMFLGCADHPRLGGRLENCLTFWPEQEPVETESAGAFCVLVAAAFLRELNDLCARRLRRNFIRAEANLTGKAKGKILTMENIRRNLSRGRAERAHCAFQSVSDDILENRILRAALERAAIFLSPERAGSGGEILRRWIRAGRSGLRGVSAVRVRGGDFSAARVRGAFSHYRRPLRLARAVLESSGFDLDGSRPLAVSPFALNSAELFERWAELRLLEAHPNLQSGRADISAAPAGSVAVRPDFWIPAGAGSAMILDAKYKALPESVKEARADIFQVVAYSRHRKFLADGLGIGPADSVRLALLYPAVGAGGIGKGDADESFHAPLSFWRIPCPAKRSAAGMAESAETAAA